MHFLRRFVDDERVRYLAVGGWNTLFGYLLFLLMLATLGKPVSSLESSGVPLIHWIGREYYVIVGWVGWVFAVMQSTATMKYLVFRKGGSYWKQVFRAYFVYLPSQFLGSALLWFVVRVVGLSPQVGALVNTVIITVVSYLGHKYFTFRVPLEVGEISDEVFEHTAASGPEDGGDAAGVEGRVADA
ncbi:MAG: GtrA family protein [Actinobacteria bacterium]|nr:GtrA family protein [Actinomycetota bacterium]